MRIVFGIQPISPPAPRIISHAPFLTRRPLYATKGFTSHIIYLHLSTILTIVSIGLGFIKVNNWPTVWTVLHHFMKVSVLLFNNARLFIIVVSVIHYSFISIKYNINRHQNKSTFFIRWLALLDQSHQLTDIWRVCTSLLKLKKQLHQCQLSLLVAS